MNTILREGVWYFKNVYLIRHITFVSVVITFWIVRDLGSRWKFNENIVSVLNFKYIDYEDFPLTASQRNIFNWFSSRYVRKSKTKSCSLLQSFNNKSHYKIWLCVWTYVYDTYTQT